jgi:DNA polymerase III sliding clamp (beta) subunit (PCNA family)
VKLSAQACLLSDAISLANVIKRGADSQCLAHLAATRDAISISYTDKTVGTIATSVPATIHEPGETAVSSGRLAALVSSFAGDATIEIDATARTVNVVSGSSRSRLAAVPVSDLPSAVAIDQEIGRTEASCVDCLELLEPLAVADAGRARFHLAGVFWHTVADQLFAVSTDGSRLIRTSVAASSFSADRTLIVPTEVAIAVRTLLKKTDASRVTLRRSRSLIVFEATSFSFTARLIDASFPAYESVIPAPASNAVVCDRHDLLAAVSRLSAAAPSFDTSLVALSWENGNGLDLHLARRPLDGADVIPARVRGSAKVALSLPQFAALLKEFRGEHIQLETANEQPVVIRGAGEKLGLMVRSKWNFGNWREAM